MKIFIFLNAILSIANAYHGLNYTENEAHIERRSLYKVMSKPYVLELLNSKSVGELKKTPCWSNLHYLISNPDLHYLAKLPMARALFTARLPEFQEFLLNLKKGKSAAKGKDLSKKFTAMINRML